jgi:hypothetical protein
MGGGGQTSTTEAQFMPEDIQLRRLGLDYAHAANGLGGNFSQPGPGAQLDPWTDQVRHQYLQDLRQNVPMTGSQWQNMSQQAAMYNPLANMGGMGGTGGAPVGPSMEGMAAPVERPDRMGPPGIAPMSVPRAQGLATNPMGMVPQAHGLSANPMSMAPEASRYSDPGTEWAMGRTAQYGGPGQGGQYTNTPQGVAAYDPSTALQGAQGYMQQVLSPQLQQAAVSGGGNPMSGAYAEAMANASSGMAMDINRQVMQNQANWYNPQMQATLQGGLAQQGAQNQLLSQGFQGGIQGELARQGAQNQFMGQGYGGAIQGLLGQQAAQNQFTGQGYGGAIQGLLGQQGAQNQMMSQGFGGQLQGALNQQQNVFNQAMQSPAAQNQLLQGLQGNYGAQMDLANMPQNAEQQDYLRRQALWQQVVSGLYGGGGMQPISQTTNTGGGGGFNMGGALGGMGGGAAMGAMMGSAVGGVGALPGAAIGGLGGLFSGGFCWVADALYGEYSEDAQAARAWVSEGWQGEEADEFREWYKEHGQNVANAIHERGEFWKEHGETYYKLFDEFVEKGRGYLASRHHA